MQEKFQTVLERIDALNKQDPNRVEDAGVSQPYELAYSRWLRDWVSKLNPHASELLQIAAHGQHVGRWQVSRSSYEATRGGYLRWREDLKKRHAETVTTFMSDAGYPPEDVERVGSIILKKNLRTDPDTQTLEDALCLVFLERQMKDVAAKTLEEKMIAIIRKTWQKMSPEGQEQALRLTFPAPLNDLMKRALAT